MISEVCSESSSILSASLVSLNSLVDLPPHTSPRTVEARLTTSALKTGGQGDPYQTTEGFNDGNKKWFRFFVRRRSKIKSNSSTIVPNEICF